MIASPPAAFDEANPEFSPDGHWLAYQSNESGRPEVYVRSFPGPGGKWLVSAGGGSFPTWSRASRELFWTFDQRIMVAPYAADADSFRAEKPRLWSEARIVDQPRRFDLHPDGLRFAAVRDPGTSEVKRDRIVLIVNFFDELRRIAPVPVR